MPLCTEENVLDHILQDYVQKAEEFNPGITARTIEAVSGEVTDLLSYRYPQPWPSVPKLITDIAAVFSAYRIVTAITTIVDTEGQTDNEWIPLQRKLDRYEKLLDDLAKGKLKLPFEEDFRDREDPTVAVISKKRIIDMRGF